jgi:hypothetical protein
LNDVGMTGVLPPARVLVRHVLLPGLAPAAMVGLAFTPIEVFGCVGRGLLALGVTLGATLAACVTTAIGARARARRDFTSSERWLLSTLILVLLAALLLAIG